MLVSSVSPVASLQVIASVVATRMLGCGVSGDSFALLLVGKDGSVKLTRRYAAELCHPSVQIVFYRRLEPKDLLSRRAVVLLTKNKPSKSLCDE